MDLETLQVVLEMNVEKVQASIDKILPSINNMMSKIERVTGKSMDQTEKKMDIDKGTANVEKQLVQMNKIVEKQLASTEKLVERMSTNTGKNLSKGFAKGRTQVNKDVDALVKDINAKMMQAKSQQEKLAFIKTQRQTASSIGDTSGVIRFDEQIANAQAAMTRYQTSAENLARSMRQEFISLPKSLEGISTAMNKNEAQIESMRSKIKNLQVTYNDQLKPKGSFSEGFKGGDETKSSTKTASLIEKQTIAMNKLIAQNDGLQQAYAKTQDRAKALSPIISKLNTNLGDTNGYTATKENVKDIGTNFKSSGGKLAKFGSLFSGLGNKMNKSGPKMNKPMNSINKTLSSFVRRLLIAGLAYKAFAGMASYMGKAVLSNEQFSKSLNEVKVNLATAFFPIYQAIMPALNALIAWLAKATAYMASFIATLFGTTYSAAKKGANALNENIAAMSDTGSNADKAKEKVKKFQNVLAGFDEINTLDFKTDTDDESLTGKGPANGINFGIADPGIPAWVNTFADRFKSILKDLFAPIKAAWNKHGQKVMDAWKYALSEVGGLLSSIGKSFMEVWTNGTGERFVGNLLILLADVLNIIGDIAKAFKDAWNDDNRGTNLIQSIFNAWNGVLELLHEIADSFRKAWNNGNGERIAANILEIYTNIFNTIGNIADGLKEAWLENDNGYRIFDNILGVVGGLLEDIKQMSKATEEWADKLDFTPLLTSIAGLFSNVRPIISTIGDALSWLYEKILLPIAKWAIENALPVAVDAISEAFRFLGNVIEKAKPVLSWLWENLLKPMGEFAGKRLVSELESIRDAFKFLADAVEDPKKAFSDLSDKAKEKFTDLKEKSGEIWGKISEYITGGSKEAKDNVKLNFDEISVKSFSVFSGVGELASKIFPKLSKTISDNVGAAKNAVSTKFSEMYTATSNWFGKIGAKTKEIFDAVSSKVSEKAKSAYDAASTKWKELSSNTSTKWEEIRSATSTKWSETKDAISNKASEAKNNAISAWSIMKSKTSEYMDGIKENSRKGFDQVVSWATGLGGKIAEGLRKGIEGVKKAAKEMSQGLVNVLGKGVNGTIKGVNWVLSKVGSDKKLAEWKVPEYAKGTSRHPGGPALVNDSSGSVYQEAYELPDGTRGLFPKIRNMMVDMPANTKVLTAARTVKEQIPHYKNGVGDWISEKWNGAKEMAGDVWDYVKKPEELVKNAISKFTNLSKAKDPGVSIAKGAIATASSGAIQMVKDAFAFDNGTGGIDFKGLTKTSDFGYRIHPITGVRKLHAGVDYGGGQGIGHPIHAQAGGKVTAAGPNGNGFGTMVKASKGVYDYIYAHLSKALVDKGDNIKAGQKIGLMGNTGASTGPHVHYEVRKDGKPINPLSGTGGESNSPQGSGVARWTSTIKRALSMNGLPSTALYTNAWLKQVQSESGGNEKAIQGNIGDINNKTGDLAKGLLQTISSTFNAYKHKGHNNIFNGYDNSLAAINYAKSRYGAKKMLNVIGHGHGYENGGLISEEQMIRVGEGNNDEMVIPLTKPSRALELIGQSLDYLGMDFGDLTMPTALQPSYESFAFDGGTFEGSGSSDQFESMADSMSNAVKKAFTMVMGEKQSSNNDSGPIEVTMVIDSDTFGKVVVKSVNKLTKKTGKPQIIM
ncbi:peptidoglycan DD-metalloendopeptidase family protein [Carnobacterium pleistocenium]|uniref:peptidoglycan DD-metalloendopeptidase family protein n=1 Tax=Carnobacterium pleistocenium TaxID=181073 RepID=UPI000555AC42|nr:peptidoglycan DD-metalloendopeptidase family protein [Carnobacterium pleistocenium]